MIDRNRFNYIDVIPEDLVKDKLEFCKIDEFRSSLAFYEQKIIELSKLKAEEEKRYNSYLLEQLSKVEGIEAIEFDGSIIKCENTIFLYNNGWTIFSKEGCLGGNNNEWRL